MRSFDPKALADGNAERIRARFNIHEAMMPKAFLQLGTGWGDLLKLEGEQRLSLHELPGFEALTELDGHERVLCYGRVGDAWVMAQRGRVHLNEGVNDAAIPQMVRLQVEQAIELGVKTFILTNAVGSLGGRVSKGSVVAVDGFITLFAPDLPLYPGEFCSPEDVLDPSLIELAQLGGSHADHLAVVRGGYLMLRGPQFEGRRYDKAFLASTGAHCVGMSLLPEAAVLSVYRSSRRLRALCLSYVTNDDKEEHSHEANQAQAKTKAEGLRLLLEHVLSKL
jgi:purine-nucleoside phosphorylase